MPCMTYQVVCDVIGWHANIVTPLRAYSCFCRPQDVVEESVQQLLKATNSNSRRSNSSSSIAATTQSGKWHVLGHCRAGCAQHAVCWEMQASSSCCSSYHHPETQCSLLLYLRALLLQHPNAVMKYT